MSYSREIYRWKTGSYCERCKKMDTDRRLVQIEVTGSGAAYLCIICVRDILGYLEAKVTITSASFAMYREDFVKYIDPSGLNTPPSVEAVREAIGQWDTDFRSLLKEFLEYKNGYTDRTKFSFDLKKQVKILQGVFEQHLKRT